MHRYACFYALLAALCLVVGCSSNQTPTVTNPFTTADRVPPPTMLSAPGAPPAVYAGPTTAASPYGAAPAHSPAAPSAAPSSYTSASPYSAAPSYGSPPSTYAPTTPAPGTATPYYGAATSPRATAPGDTIAVPSDTASVRFATLSDTSLARQQPQPVPRAGSTQLAANPAPQRPVASASGWIAGSAPVRTDTLAGSPRVRVPGESFGYEPVSLAAIGQPQGVPIAPLEPAPTGSRPGDPAPLRVAVPPSSTGWR